MNKELKIAIDCDEVLRQTAEKLVEIYNKEFNASKTKEDVKYFNVDMSFPAVRERFGISAADWFFRLYSREVFYESKSFPGSIWAINTLKRYGDVTILTSQRSYKNKRDTLDFLHREQLDTVNVCFLDDKSRLDCDIIIDDNPDNFKNCTAKVCVLITAPYNKDTDLNDILNSCNCEKVMRFESLFDFTKYFKQVNGRLF